MASPVSRILWKLTEHSYDKELRRVFIEKFREIKESWSSNQSVINYGFLLEFYSLDSILYLLDDRVQFFRRANARRYWVITSEIVTPEVVEDEVGVVNERKGKGRNTQMRDGEHDFGDSSHRQDLRFRANLGAGGRLCTSNGSSGARDGFEVTKFGHGRVALIGFPRYAQKESKSSRLFHVMSARIHARIPVRISIRMSVPVRPSGV
ncbi:hypothetical protein Syun_029436 [Stephania yunnanensis]|uniref:Uncharacterized protein n=1 Tax=Stephania yunnanensis TaxID=152371 RepID=A0AAP0HJG5_9MAGN